MLNFLSYALQKVRAPNYPGRQEIAGLFVGVNVVGMVNREEFLSTLFRFRQPFVMCTKCGGFSFVRSLCVVSVAGFSELRLQDWADG